ncbi:MAG: protein adenylyltransferase SelO family protein [Dermabacter sp.]|nr:protein adenylyltransferase SelO family protein [Dermabacter sp.]
MTTAPPLVHTYADAFPGLVRASVPDVPEGTRALVVNEDVARALGCDPAWLAGADGIRWLTGTGTGAGQPTEAASRTVAEAYAGHQFGHFSPELGDGRAHLVGEARTEGGALADIHLKGSGRTPFARAGADGKAPLAAMLREYVISEALAALGVPTTRTLAVLATGEQVRRRSPVPEPAGILVRTAASHLRVGTFQYAALHLERAERERLVAYALERHSGNAGDAAGPSATTDPSATPAPLATTAPSAIQGAPEPPALTLLRAVAERQAALVAAWMGIGFVHGVMNTDNMSISGESIDFGPCAFIDDFSHAAVFSSIDREGRYSYRNQPAMAQWNLARLAESLLDLIDPENPNEAVERASGVLTHFEQRYRAEFARVFARKLGVRAPESEAEEREVSAVAESALDMLDADSVDFTIFFRTLAEDPSQLPSLTRMPGTAHTWLARWRELHASLGGGAGGARTDGARADGALNADAAARMRAANPVYIPRNRHVERALAEAVSGNMAPLESLVAAIRDPFTRRAEFADLEVPPPGARGFTSYCGT